MQLLIILAHLSRLPNITNKSALVNALALVTGAQSNLWERKDFQEAGFASLSLTITIRATNKISVNQGYQ